MTAGRRSLAVNLFFPGHPAPLKVIHLNQTNLSEVLKAVGAIGFRTAHEDSWRLEDLPESGDVQVVLAEPADPFEEAQVCLWFDFCLLDCLLAALHCKIGAATRSLCIPLPCIPLPTSVGLPRSPLVQVDTNTALQVAAVSPTRIKELAALLRTVASTENPGATITALQGEPFKDIGGKVRAGARPGSRPAYRSSNR